MVARTVGTRAFVVGAAEARASGAGERAQHIEFARIAFQRAMERRLAQHAARPADRRGRELLRRLQRPADPAACPCARRRICVPRRTLAHPRRQTAWRTERALAAYRFRDVFAEPRS